MTEEKRKGRFTGLKVPDLMTIWHLPFIENILLFSHSFVIKMVHSKKIIEIYCNAIGMEVNVKVFHVT